MRNQSTEVVSFDVFRRLGNSNMEMPNMLCLTNLTRSDFGRNFSDIGPAGQVRSGSKGGVAPLILWPPNSI